MIGWAIVRSSSNQQGYVNFNSLVYKRTEGKAPGAANAHPHLSEREMNQDRMSANSGGRPTCVVRGSINHDEYFYVHHIARPGETISSYDHESRVGGKGANQAVAVARAGAAVRFYGTIGEDGLWIKERMERWGIGVEGILVGDEPTGRAIIQVDEEGENSIILFPGANHSELHETLFSRHASPSSSPPPPHVHPASASRSPLTSHSSPPTGWFPPATHLLLQNEISRASTYYALQHAREGTTVVLNPSPLPSEEEIRAFMWHRVDWLLVNEREARGLYGALTNRGGKEGSARASSSPRINPGGGGGVGGSGTGNSMGSPTQTLSNRELIARLSALPAFANVNIVCTLGADGVLAFVPAFHRPRTPVEAPSFMHLPAARLIGGVPKDTTGAGDTFAGYFVAGLMEFGEGAWVGRGVGHGSDGRVGGRGREIKEADVVRLLKVCVQAAGMCVEKSGTIESIPTRAQVEERMAMAMSA
ncbi:unnamed protein product [Cyclocybe aegerita]|uniref:Ribokinase n=1 Tax=Cyclocybe aegerita TaxID=1973307 RepID=A0A8S0W0C8_CYCAE|nr:unnamed protein product [Cyclocybe aegerita]